MHVQHAIPVVVRHLEEQVVTQDACVIHQNIQLAKALQATLHRAPDRGVIRDVAPQRECLCAAARDLRRRALTAFLVQVRQDDPGALLCQSPRSCRANTARRARHQRDTAIQTSQSSHLSVLIRPAAGRIPTVGTSPRCAMSAHACRGEQSIGCDRATVKDERRTRRLPRAPARDTPSADTRLPLALHAPAWLLTARRYVRILVPRTRPAACAAHAPRGTDFRYAASRPPRLLLLRAGPPRGFGR